MKKQDNGSTKDDRRNESKYGTNLIWVQNPAVSYVSDLSYVDPGAEYGMGGQSKQILTDETWGIFISDKTDWG